MDDDLQVRRTKHHHMIVLMNNRRAQNGLIKASKKLRVLGVDEYAGASWCRHDDPLVLDPLATIAFFATWGNCKRR
ncbi:hypothetical protein SAMN02745674_01792 [Lysobacter spongiicola DSM 21749]|uniref:Uncharacterized protein n=1 Tax=Lysobacter spongiicola DSM 21749 TaxID=1122188 RepID=A0A1T4QRX7_9GAMM|nr:hypothetical protein SAMN02745674_01792 [Lysobacter spongiicola DSM 21749]